MGCRQSVAFREALRATVVPWGVGAVAAEVVILLYLTSKEDKTSLFTDYSETRDA